MGFRLCLQRVLSRTNRRQYQLLLDGRDYKSAAIYIPLYKSDVRVRRLLYKRKDVMTVGTQEALVGDVLVKDTYAENTEMSSCKRRNVNKSIDVKRAVPARCQ